MEIDGVPQPTLETVNTNVSSANVSNEAAVIVEGVEQFPNQSTGNSLKPADEESHISRTDLENSVRRTNSQKRGAMARRNSARRNSRLPPGVSPTPVAGEVDHTATDGQQKEFLDVHASGGGSGHHSHRHSTSSRGRGSHHNSQNIRHKSTTENDDANNGEEGNEGEGKIGEIRRGYSSSTSIGMSRWPHARELFETGKLKNVLRYEILTY